MLSGSSLIRFHLYHGKVTLTGRALNNVFRSSWKGSSHNPRERAVEVPSVILDI